MGDSFSLTAVVIWWELRRIPYNLIIGSFGVLCLLIFYWAISAAGHLGPGEDAIEPLALFVAPVLVNICYTAGWVVEVACRKLGIVTTRDFGPRLLRFGMLFSLFIVSLPALIWTDIWLLQLLHLIHKP